MTDRRAEAAKVFGVLDDDGTGAVDLSAVKVVLQMQPQPSQERITREEFVDALCEEQMGASDADFSSRASELMAAASAVSVGRRPCNHGPKMKPVRIHSLSGRSSYLTA